MRSTTANYDTENALNAQDPVVLVQFDGVTREYSSDTFSGIDTDNVKKYISYFMAKFSPINLLESFQELGQMVIKVIDESQDVTSVLNSDPILEKDVTVKIGFQGIAEADFVTLPTQRILDNPRIVSNMREWQFVTRDAQRLISGKIGRKIPTTSLDADATDSATSITVLDTTGFGSVANVPDKNIVQRMYLKINNEIVSYTGSTGTTFTGMGRELNFTTPRAHSDGDEVSQVYHFAGMYPTEALLHILLTTDNGTGHEYYDLTRFDASFEGMGLGINAGLVDIETIERLGYKFFNLEYEDCGGLHIYQEEDAFEWIVENILKPGGLILIRDTNGLLSLTSIDRLQFIDNFSSSADLDDDDIVEMESFEIDYKNVLNDIKFVYRTKGLGNAEEDTVDCLLPDSIVAYRQREKQFEVISPLCSGDSHSGNAITSDDDVLMLSRRWFHTFGNPLGLATFTSRQSLWATEPTDTITLTITEMPDTDDGSKGWSSKKFFVTGQEISLSPAVYRYNALTWEAYTELSTFYDFTTVESFDDDDVAYNADSSITLDTEDGYYDLPGFVTLNGVTLVTLEITPPGSGGTEHFMDIEVHFIDTVTGPTLESTKTFKSIRYNSGDSTAFDVVLGCFFPSDVTNRITFDRIKVDFYNTSAASAERPSSITITEIKYSTFQVDVESGTNVTDSFTDSNGTAIGSHTADTGQGWSVDSGAAEIQSNALDVTSATLIAYVSTSIGRYMTQQVDVTVSAGTGWEAGIIFRRADANNYMKLTLDETGNTLDLIKVEGGSPTTIASGGITVSAATTYTVQVRVWSQIIYCHADDGTTFINFTDATSPSFNPDEGDHGLYSDTANAGFDDFSLISDS